MSNSLRGRLVLAALVAALNLAACQGSKSTATPKPPSGSPASTVSGTATPAPSPRAAFDVCTLTTPEAIGAAFGGRSRPGEVGTFVDGSPACTFAVRATNLGQDLTAEIILLRGYTATKFASMKQTGLPAGDVAVAGVGDDAFYDPKTLYVVVLKGGGVFLVGAVFKPPSGPVPDAPKVKADVLAAAGTLASPPAGAR